MQLTHAYWNPPPLYSFSKITFTNTQPNDLGFRHDIPVPMPVSIGEGYFGSNESVLNIPKQLVFSNQGEYFTRGGYIRTVDQKPLVNVYNPIFNYKRSKMIRDTR